MVNEFKWRQTLQQREEQKREKIIGDAEAPSKGKWAGKQTVKAKLGDAVDELRAEAEDKRNGYGIY